MIKRTLYFGNPAYLSLKLRQLVVSKPGADDSKAELVKTIPIEDIATIVLDCKQITITQALLEELLEANCDNMRFDTHADRIDAAAERTYAAKRAVSGPD